MRVQVFGQNLQLSVHLREFENYAGNLPPSVHTGTRLYMTEIFVTQSCSQEIECYVNDNVKE